MSTVTGSCASRSRAAALSARVAPKRWSPMVIWILILFSFSGSSSRSVLADVVGLLLMGAVDVGVAVALSGRVPPQPAPTTPTAASTAISGGNVRTRSPGSWCQRVSRTLVAVRWSMAR